MTDSHADTRKASDLFIECLELEQELATVRTQHLGTAFNCMAKRRRGEVLNIN